MRRPLAPPSARAALAPRALALCLLAGLASGLCGCGGGEERRIDTGPAMGTRTETAGADAPSLGAPSLDAVDLGLRRADGTFVDVADLRGSFVLLFVFATFDGVSQMLLSPLRSVAERHADLHIVGVAAQPSARLLVDAYEHALEPPFPITYDPEETILEGARGLGAIEAIPTLVVLDRRGIEVARHTGFADEAMIEELLRGAGVR